MAECSGLTQSAGPLLECGVPQTPLWFLVFASPPRMPGNHQVGLLARFQDERLPCRALIS
jgi:hypothetical protein